MSYEVWWHAPNDRYLIGTYRLRVIAELVAFWHLPSTVRRNSP